MPRVIVWSRDPVESFPIDLDQTFSFHLGDYPRGKPIWGKLCIHHEPHPVKPRLFLGYNPFVHLPGNRVKWDSGRVEPLNRIKAPLESLRRYVTISWEEAQNYARHFEKTLPFGCDPAGVPENPDSGAMPARLLEETDKKLTTYQAKLVRFLAAKEGWRATFETITTKFRRLNLAGMASHRRKTCLRSTRRSAERVRRALEGEDCRLRLRTRQNAAELYTENIKS
jgi:hypothetical protein